MGNNQGKGTPPRNAYLVKGYNLKYKFGITVRQFDQMLLAQLGRCAVCRKVMEKPHVDHCHKTKKVRGLLCFNCNIGIGYLKDDPAALRRAADYLERGEFPWQTSQS